MLIGSFLNVVIYRLPIILKNDWRSQALEFLEEDSIEQAGQASNNKATANESAQKKKTLIQQLKALFEKENPTTYNLVVPRSHCPHCKQAVTALQNIPLLSYLLLKGKCRHCQTGISVRYPLVEITTALLFAYAAFQFNYSLQFLMIALLSSGLIALTLIDYDHQILPDNLVYPLLWLGLLYSPYNPSVTVENSVIGAAAGYLILSSVTYTYKLLTGKHGMGNGDFKLLAVFGAWLGWTVLPLIIVLSSLVGSIIGISLILFKGRDSNQPIPFGPFLAIAGLIAIYWGQDITKLYLAY